MAQQLAKTTFYTGPSDSLATVDVYTQRSNSVINNTPDSLAAVNFGGTSSLFGGSNMLGSLPLGGMLGGGLTSTLSSLTGRLGITNPALAKAVTALTPIAAKAIESKLPMGKINNMVATFNGISQTINMAKNGNIMGVVQSVNSIAQNLGVPGITISDPKGLLKVASGLATQGVRNGVPGVMTTLNSSGMFKSQGELNSLTREVMPSITERGDLGSLKELAAISPGAATSITDDALGNFAKYYPDPESPKSTSQYQQDFGDIKSTFGTLKPSWLTSPTGGVDTLNLTTVAGASEEFKKTVTIGAINSDDPNDKWLLAASAPPSSTLTLDQTKALDGITIDGYTKTQLDAMNGITITAGETKFTPFSEEEAAAKYQAYLKERNTTGIDPVTGERVNGSASLPSSEERAAQLYPAATGLGATSTAPVDPRSLAQVEQVKQLSSGQKSVIYPSRTVEQLQQEMDTYAMQWTEQLNSRSEPLYQAAADAKKAGDMDLFNQKMAEEKALEAELDAYYGPKMKRCREEIKIWQDNPISG